MTTTALIVEVLVIGALALGWLATTFAALLPTPTAAQTVAAASLLKDVAPLLVLPALALTYAVGWIVNFCSERLLKIFFQHRIRDTRFGGSEAYETARFLVLQRGSPELVHDVLVDRHIIRLARGGAMNFTLMAIALFVHGLRGWSLAWPFTIFCVLCAALSFAQWLTRYRSHYARIERIGTFLSRDTLELKAV